MKYCPWVDTGRDPGHKQEGLHLGTQLSLLPGEEAEV